MKIHQPVMLEETMAALAVKAGAWYLDATFGRGGHTQAILERGGRVLACDWDDQAIAYGRNIFQSALTDHQLILRHQDFATIGATCQKLRSEGEIGAVEGILFDFGASTDQLLDSERGFSFDRPSPLDMRMDRRKQVKAQDLLAVLSRRELAAMFREYGGEDRAELIAKAIVTQRPTKPITTTNQLAELITKLIRRRGSLHPATKVFQALRIAVNSELESLAEALPPAFEALAPGGKMVCLSFHQGEDKIVKIFFKKLHGEERGEILTKKPLIPSPEEVTANPRSRSAKLRILLKK